jgi:5-methylcytosine-specific restriction endonuclease McrA
LLSTPRRDCCFRRIASKPSQISVSACNEKARVQFCFPAHRRKLQRIEIHKSKLQKLSPQFCARCKTRGSVGSKRSVRWQHFIVIRMHRLFKARPAIRSMKSRGGHTIDMNYLCGLQLERDGWRCPLCGSSSDLQIHHLRSRSKLGDDELSNLIMLCVDCHGRQHEYRPTEFA